jgi:hypothetical protein
MVSFFAGILAAILSQPSAERRRQDDMRVRPPSRRHPLTRFVGNRQHGVDDGVDCSFETVLDAKSSPPPGQPAQSRLLGRDVQMSAGPQNWYCIRDALKEPDCRRATAESYRSASRWRIGYGFRSGFGQPPRPIGAADFCVLPESPERHVTTVFPGPSTTRHIPNSQSNMVTTTRTQDLAVSLLRGTATQS